MRKLTPTLIACTILLFSCQQDGEEVLNVTEAAPTYKEIIPMAYPDQTPVLETYTYADGSTVTLENYDGQYVMCGDIVLDDEQVNLLKTGPDPNARTGMSDLYRRWPNCTMYYAISPDLPRPHRVLDAMKEISDAHPQIKFVERTDQRAYVYFYRGGGCSSSLGMRGYRQYISMADACSTGSAIHEILHAMGVFHEQSRADRDEYVTIYWDRIRPGYAHNFYTYSALGYRGFEFGEFDFNSIMMYPYWAWSTSYKPTITLKSGKTYPYNMRYLSQGDHEIIDLMYPCAPLPVQMIGPLMGNNYDAYTWSVSVTEGQGPYTCKWMRSTDKGLSYSEQWPANGLTFTNMLPHGEDLYLEVEVTDATGRSGKAYWHTTNTSGFVQDFGF